MDHNLILGLSDSSQFKTHTLQNKVKVFKDTESSGLRVGEASLWLEGH